MKMHFESWRSERYIFTSCSSRSNNITQDITLVTCNACLMSKKAREITKKPHFNSLKARPKVS